MKDTDSKSRVGGLEKSSREKWDSWCTSDHKWIDCGRNKGRIKGLLLRKEYMQRRKWTCMLRKPVSPESTLLLIFISWTSVGWVVFYHLQRLFLLSPLLKSLRQLPAFTSLYFCGWETEPSFPLYGHWLPKGRAHACGVPHVWEKYKEALLVWIRPRVQG